MKNKVFFIYLVKSLKLKKNEKNNSMSERN